MSPLNGFSRQKSGSITEPVQEKDSKSEPVRFPNNSQKNQPEVRKIDNYSTANGVADDNNPPLTKTE